MRKIPLLFAVFILSLMANAQTTFPVDETFATGFPNLQAVSTTLTANGWTTVTGSVSTTFSKTTISPMVYPPTGTSWINSGIGNALYVNYTGVSNATSYSFKQFQDTPVSSGVLYLSFLYQCTANGGSGSQIMGISDVSSTSNTGAVVYCSYNATGFSNQLRIGVTRASATNADVQFGTTQITLNTVYLIVMKYDFTAAKATLYVNPAVGGTESAATVWSYDDGTVNGKTAKTQFQYLKVCNSGSNKAYFDVSGARISTSWTDAVAPYASALPALSTPVASSAQTITNTGFTANWTNGDASATGFKVQTYLGTNPVPVNTTNAGAGTTSVNVTGLMSGVDYTYTVTAIGNNTSNQNSIESSTSSFTTTGKVSSLNTDFGDNTWGNGTTYNSITPTVSASYPTYSINGFDFIATCVYSSSATGPKAEVHSAYLKLDKGNLGAMVILPTVTSVNQLEIHANNVSTTTPRTFTLQQLISGVWTNVGAGSGSGTGLYDLPITQAEMIYVIPITTNNTNAKFRILNTASQSGGINVMQIITRTKTPATLTSPTVGVSDVAGNITDTGFTANWSTGDANASGYKVFLYAGSTLVGTYNTSNDNTLRSLAISGLTSSTAYTYKVGSIGDGDNLYSDSYVSAASAVFTTSVATAINSLNENFLITVSGKTILTSETAMIQVYNLQGAKMLEAQAVNKLNTNLASGIYLVKLMAINGQIKNAKVQIK